MLWKKQEDWQYYDTGLMATGYADALFLKKWFRSVLFNNREAQFFNVADLQRYRLYNNPSKVGIAMRERSKIPFVFVIGKN